MRFMRQYLSTQEPLYLANWSKAYGDKDPYFTRTLLNKKGDIFRGE